MPRAALFHHLTRAEWETATQAHHGNVRRYLAGCRCEKCDRPGNWLFAALNRWKPNR